MKDLYLTISPLQTAELTERMKGLGESKLRDFALDVPTGSVYHFEGEDFREKKKVCHIAYRLVPSATASFD